MPEFSSERGLSCVRPLLQKYFATCEITRISRLGANRAGAG